MRDIPHPAAAAITLDQVLHALADPLRRMILGEIHGRATAVCSEIAPALPRSTVSVHLRVLREAGLIEQERCGQLIRNAPRPDGARARFAAVVDAIMATPGDGSSAARDAV